MPKDLQHHFQSKERHFFDEIKPFLRHEDRVIKVGNGFGYLSTFIASYVAQIDIFEIHLFDKTINKGKVRLYDGKILPVDDKSYDVAVFNLVLHHIPHNTDYLRQVVTKTSRIIILYEQTYDTIFQKLQLVWRDWYINVKAGTPSRIYWKSYLKRKDIENIAAALGLRIMHRTTKKSHYYFKELIIFEIN